MAVPIANSISLAVDRESGSSVIRLKTRGRLDFWTLGNEIAGRSRRYGRVVIDEAAFAKDGDNKVDGSMMEIWEKAIEPTLFDYGGEVLICSNSAGKNPDSFFYNICTDPSYGFREFHATTMACNGTKMASAVIPRRSRVRARRTRLWAWLPAGRDRR